MSPTTPPPHGSPDTEPHPRARTSDPALVDRLNPWSPEVLEDPYPWYAALRDHDPVHHVPEHDLWVLTRYEDVTAAVRDTTTFSSDQGNSYERRPVPMLVGLDPPEHTRVRRLVARHWTPRALEALRPRIERLVDGIVTDALERGEIDFLVDVCEPLPVTLIAEIMGVPTADWADFRRWSDATTAQMAGPPTEENEAQILEFAMYFLDLVTRRQAAYDDGHADIDDPNDMVGVLFGRTPEGDRLTPEEIVAMCVLLIVAGNETTTNLMANMGVDVLLERPEVWARVTSDPSLVGALVEEGLRWTSPVQGLYRNTKAPVELHGRTIPADAKVFMCYAAANRDERHWPDAAEFRLDRYPAAPNDADHIAFASGAHHCLGAHLARMEGRIMFDALARRVGTIEANGPLVRGGNPSIRGIRHLPVRITGR